MEYEYLEKRENESGISPFIKGTRIRASTVYGSMIANHQSVSQAALDRGIPVKAVKEARHWCVKNKRLIAAEALATQTLLAKYSRRPGPS